MFTNLKIRTYTEEKVKVYINAKKGTIATYNRNKPSEEYCIRNMRGLGPVGYPCNIFSKREIKKTYEEAFLSYLEMHPSLTEKEKEVVLKKIHSNLNIAVLRALEDYDFVEVGIAGKYGDYLEAMLKPIAKKQGESKRKYAKREIRLRRNELRRAGISIIYVLGRGLSVFNKNINIFDNRMVKKEAKKYASYARIESGRHIVGKPRKTLRIKREAPKPQVQNIILSVPEVVEVKLTKVEQEPKKELRTLKLCRNFGM